MTGRKTASPDGYADVSVAISPDISVDGVLISRDAIEAEMRHVRASSSLAWVERWKRAARALVVRQLLLAEAHKVLAGGFPPPLPDETREEAAIRVLLEREIHVPDPTDDEIARWFQANQETATHSAVRLKHLLVRSDLGSVPLFTPVIIPTTIFRLLKNQANSLARKKKPPNAPATSTLIFSTTRTNFLEWPCVIQSAHLRSVGAISALWTKESFRLNSKRLSRRSSLAR